MEKKSRNRSIAIFNARVTATISVALVLLILGIAAFTGIVTNEITRDIKENLGFDVSLVEDIEQSEIERVHNMLNSNGIARQITIHTPEDAAKEWEETMGENVVELCDVNPFPTMIEVKVKAEYASPDSLTKITEELRKDAAVASINMNADMIDSINSNMQTIYLILSAIGIALLLISFVLINNTVHLTVYSRRFLIHTMKLVGATHGFIRRPFIVDNMINGAVAGILASLILLLLMVYGPDTDLIYSGAELIPMDKAVIVFAGLILAGIAICAIASLFAANKYLNKNYDEMFD